MKTTVETITPDVARAFLAMSPGNREVSERTVKKYAADMAAGRWTLTHQGVAFDAQGDFVDGHQRMRAIIMSGATVSMMVVRGIPTESKTSLDIGKSRSIGDMLTFMGVATTLPSTQVLTFILEQTEFSATRSEKQRGEAAKHLADLWKDELAWVEKMLSMRRRGVGTRPVRAAFLAALLNDASLDYLIPAAQLLQSGVAKDREVWRCDSTMHSLARWLRDSQSGKNRDTQREAYSKTSYMLYAFCEGCAWTKCYSPNQTWPGWPIKFTIDGVTYTM